MNLTADSSRKDSSKYRKPNRLPAYDYSAPGYYFITICTENHEPLFGQISSCGDGIVSARMVLNEMGKTVERTLLEIPAHYPNTRLDHYVVMPNHIHLILVLEDVPGKSPSISRIIQQFKRAVTLQLGGSVWQLGFHDHVIRGDKDYREIWSYIDNNPLKWALDKYYCEG